MATTETSYSSPAVGAVIGTIVGVLVGVVISSIIMIVMCVIFVRRRPKRIHAQGGAFGNAVYDGGSCMGCCCFVRTGVNYAAINSIPAHSPYYGKGWGVVGDWGIRKSKNPTPRDVPQYNLPI